MNARLGWGALISALAHGGLLWWLGPLPELEPSKQRLEVVLSSERLSSPVPIAPDRRAAVDSSRAPEAVRPAAAPRTALPASDGTHGVFPEPDVPLSEAPESHEASGLDLSRPLDWASVLEGPPAERLELPFNPALAVGLAARRTDQRRQEQVNARKAARYGVADAAYGSEGPLGTRAKHDGRCLTLVEDPGVEDGTRWWASPCRDSRAESFDLTRLEYDPLGRLLAVPGRMGVSSP